MIIKMLSQLRRRKHEHCEKFNKELKNIKKCKTEPKNIITEIKSTLEAINSRLDNMEEKISKLEWGVMKTEQKKRIFKNKDSLRHLCDNIKCSNIFIIGVPKCEEKEEGAEI